MDELIIARHAILGRLLEGALRLSMLANVFKHRHPDATAIFAALADHRRQLIGALVAENPDSSLEQSVEMATSDTAIDVLGQEAELANDEGIIYATSTAQAADRSLSATLAAMPEGAVTPELRLRIRASLSHGIESFQRLIVTGGAPNDVMNFSTKSADRGGQNRGEQRRGPIDRRAVDVWFGTNRSPIIRDGGIAGFSGDVSDDVTLGRCEIVIPRTHKIGGDKPAWWRRIILGEKPIAMETVTSIEADPFWAEVRERLSENGATTDDAIIFLHGYNVSFESAAVCAGQISADLNLPGLVAFFSWPSQGNTAHYLPDTVSIEASEIHITQFLEDFTLRSGANRIHLIAHSMGNRGLLRAVNRIAAKVAGTTGKPFGQIILAAPDVDQRTFAMLHKSYPEICEKTTIYVSENDRALHLCRLLHKAPRVGLAPPVAVIAGMDTVNVTKVDLSFLGHGYVASCRTVLTDIHQLFVSGLEPSDRAGVTAITDQYGSYWELAA